MREGLSQSNYNSSTPTFGPPREKKKQKKRGGGIAGNQITRQERVDGKKNRAEEASKPANVILLSKGFTVKWSEVKANS